MLSALNSTNAKKLLHISTCWIRSPCVTRNGFVRASRRICPTNWRASLCSKVSTCFIYAMVDPLNRWNNTRPNETFSQLQWWAPIAASDGEGNWGYNPFTWWSYCSSQTSICVRQFWDESPLPKSMWSQDYLLTVTGPIVNNQYVSWLVNVPV